MYKRARQCLKIVLVLDISPGKEGKLSQINPIFSSFSLYKKESLNILSEIARRYRYRACLAAIELANDPYVEKTLPFMPARGVAIHLLRNYYREGYYAVRACAGDDVQVIMPDAHQPSMWRVFMTAGSYRNTALDVHLDHFSDYFEMRQVLTSLLARGVELFQASIPQPHPKGVSLWNACIHQANSSYLARRMRGFSKPGRRKGACRAGMRV